MTNFENIKSMSVDELAKFLVDTRRFPYAPCYVCPYDNGLTCHSPVECSDEYKASIFKKWLEKECKE